MLRPNDFIEYVKQRVARGWLDHGSLVQGLNLTNLLVTAGGPANSARLNDALRRMNSLLPVTSITEMAQVDIRQTVVLDQQAIAQLLMLAKNESFHETADLCIQFIQDQVIDGGLTIEEGLLALRETVDKVTRM